MTGAQRLRDGCRERFSLPSLVALQTICALLVTKQQLAVGAVSVLQLVSKTCTSAGERDGLLYQFNLYQEKTWRADLFLIISLLLTGKFRNQVKNTRAERAGVDAKVSADTWW